MASKNCHSALVAASTPLMVRDSSASLDARVAVIANSFSECLMDPVKFDTSTSARALLVGPFNNVLLAVIMFNGRAGGTSDGELPIRREGLALPGTRSGGRDDHGWLPANATIHSLGLSLNSFRCWPIPPAVALPVGSCPGALPFGQVLVDAHLSLSRHGNGSRFAGVAVRCPTPRSILSSS